MPCYHCAGWCWWCNGVGDVFLAHLRPLSVNWPLFKYQDYQLNKFLSSNGYFDNFQSGFRSHHSTETALIKIINDILLNTDTGKLSILVGSYSTSVLHLTLSITTYFLTGWKTGWGFLG